MALPFDAHKPGDPTKDAPRPAREALITTAEGQRTGYATLIGAVAEKTNNLDFAGMRGESLPLAQEGERYTALLSIVESHALPQSFSVVEQEVFNKTREPDGKSAFDLLDKVHITDRQANEIREELIEKGLGDLVEGLDDYAMSRMVHESAKMQVDIAKVMKSDFGSWGPGIGISRPYLLTGYKDLREVSRGIAGVVLAARRSYPTSSEYHIGDLSKVLVSIDETGRLPERQSWEWGDSNLTHDAEKDSEIKIGGEQLGISIAARARIEGFVDRLIRKDKPSISDRERVGTLTRVVGVLESNAGTANGLMNVTGYMDGTPFAKAWEDIVTPEMVRRIQEGPKKVQEVVEGGVGGEQAKMQDALTRLAEADTVDDAEIAGIDEQIAALQSRKATAEARKVDRAGVVAELQALADQEAARNEQRTQAAEARATLGEAAEDPNRQAVLRMDADALVSLYDGDTDVLLSALEDPAGLVTKVMELYAVPAEQQSDILKAFMRVRSVAQDVKDDPDIKEEERETFARRMNSLVERIGESRIEVGREKVADMVQKAKAGETENGDDAAVQAVLARAAELTKPRE